MATRNVGKIQPSHLTIPFEQIEKTSSTLKRHPKMELSKPDLLQLLGVLEGELQAREIVIAVLKAEQVKQLLYPKKKNAVNDALSSLQRDSFGAFDATFDETAVKNLYNMQLSQFENFIRQQKNAQSKLREQLTETEERCQKILSELEEEKRKHAQDTAQGDDVTYLLEKERERLRQENEFERQQNRCMDKDIKCLTETLEQERLRQKQIVLLLLTDRRHLILRFIEEKQKNDRLSQILCDEKGRIADMVDGLEEESKKSLQMEAEMERQLCEFEIERDQLKADMAVIETRNAEMQLEMLKLQEEVEVLKKQLSIANAQAQLGEGVRSSIVTMVSTPAIRAAPTVSPTVSPPRSVARAVPTKVTAAPATPAKPLGLVTQTSTKSVVTPIKPIVPPTNASSATAQLFPAGVKTPPRLEKRDAESGELPAVSPGTGETVLSPPDPEKVVLSPSEASGQSQKPVTGKAIPAATKFTATSPGVAAKKMLPFGRGAPPPIPPNKPVLQPQALHRKEGMARPPVPPRTELLSEGAEGRKMGPRYGVIQPKSSSLEDRLTSSPSMDKDEAQVGIISEISSIVVDTTTTIINQEITANNNHLNSEALGQELADFQQVLVSMASNKVSTVSSAEQ